MAIIIPAEKIISIENFSLAKNNFIDKVNINNSNYLDKVGKKDFTITNSRNVLNNAPSTWDIIYNEGQNFTAPQYLFGGQLLADRPVSISATLTIQIGINTNMNGYPYDCGNNIQTFTVDQTLDYGQTITKTVSYSGKFPMDTGEVTAQNTVSLSFVNYNGSPSLVFTSSPSLNTSNTRLDYSYYESAEMFLTLVAQNIDVSDENIIERSVVDGNITTSFTLYCNQATLNLSDSEKFSTLQNQIKAYAVATKESSGEESTDTTNIEKYSVTILWDDTITSLSAFVAKCREKINAITSFESLQQYIMIVPSTIEKNGDEIIFSNEFQVYACLLTEFTSTANISGSILTTITKVYDYDVTLKADFGTAYVESEKSVSVGNGTNEFSIEVNELFQSDTTINGAEAMTALGNSIVNAFKNGKNTVNLTIFYGKYLDNDGNEIYNGLDGKFIKVDDVVIPYTIRNGIGEPLFKNSFSNPVEFIVTASKLTYSGNFTIQLLMIEKK